ERWQRQRQEAPARRQPRDLAASFVDQREDVVHLGLIRPAQLADAPRATPAVAAHRAAELGAAAAVADQDGDAQLAGDALPDLDAPGLRRVDAGEQRQAAPVP